MENTNEDENIDSTNDDDNQDIEKDLETDDELEDTVVETLEDAEQLKEANKQLFARAKKAEAEAKALKAKPVVKQEVEVKTDESFDEKLNKALEKRELDSLDLDEDLKNDVKTYAKMNGVSVKKAMDSNYIKFRLNEVQANAKNDDASISSTHKPTKQDYSSMSPTDFDCTTEEGVKAFEKYKEHIKNA